MLNRKTGAPKSLRSEGEPFPYLASRPRPAPPAIGSLYHADLLLWSEQQVDLLRRLARGEPVNDAMHWENVIEEAGDAGQSEFNSVASLPEGGLTYLLLVRAFPRRETSWTPTAGRPISTDRPVAIQNLVQRDPHLDGALLVRLPAAAP